MIEIDYQDLLKKAANFEKEKEQQDKKALEVTISAQNALLKSKPVPKVEVIVLY